LGSSRERRKSSASPVHLALARRHRTQLLCFWIRGLPDAIAGVIGECWSAESERGKGVDEWSINSLARVGFCREGMGQDKTHMLSMGHKKGHGSRGARRRGPRGAVDDGESGNYRELAARVCALNVILGFRTDRRYRGGFERRTNKPRELGRRN